MMRVLFLAKDKPSAHAALRYLIDAGDDVVAAVVPDCSSLAAAARGYRVPVVTDSRLYDQLANVQAGAGAAAGTAPSLDDIDLVVSFLFWKIIRPPLIDLPKIGCVNFHPAPLPDLRGLGGYNAAILDGMPEFGVSAHFVDTTIDTGDLIRVDRFPIDAARETALSLERKAQQRLVALFVDVMAAARRDGKLPREPQGAGRYIGRAEFEEMRKIQAADSPDTIDRKIRAFWYPPFPGATIELRGRTYTVIDDALLADIARNQDPA